VLDGETRALISGLMARKPPSDDIQTMMGQLLQAGITGGGRGRRSPLFRWMFSRADDLKKMLDDINPSWDAVAAVLPQTDEVKDGEGKRPNGERVRKTWFEVRQAKGWAKSPDKPPAPASPPQAKPVSAIPPSAGSTPDDPDDDAPDFNSFVKERQ
jgi:hypothetical protein